MFDRIRKALWKGASRADEDATSRMPHGPVSEWAGTQGFAFSVDVDGKGVVLEGKIGGKPWRLQLGRPTRDYIRDQEVRARAELGISEEIAVVVMNRPLKDLLEKRAYQMYTDDLQTSVGNTLPEEMRWLAMFEEVAWESLPADFWSRYGVMTNKREHAQTWIDAPLANLLMNWQSPGPTAEVPFMVLLLNGKAYLRMEYAPADLLTLQHAALIFTSACESALDAFSRK